MIRLRRILALTAGTLLGLSVSLVVVELVVHRLLIGDNERPDVYSYQLLRAGHYERGWAIEPEVSGLMAAPTYFNYVRYNDKGLRGAKRPYVPAPGVFRVLLLGDSFLEGYQIRDPDLFSSRLEAALVDRSVEVVNLSVGGYGTTQQYLYLEDEGLKYEPDLVVLAFQPGGDIRDNSFDMQRLFKRRWDVKALSRPYVVLRDGASLEISVPLAANIDNYRAWRARQLHRWRSLSLWDRLLIRRYAAFRLREETWPQVNPNILYGAYIEDFDPGLWSPQATREHYQGLWTQGWSITQRLILAISDLAAQSDARFAVMTIPARVQVDEHYLAKVEARYPTLEFDLDGIDVMAEQFARRQGIKLLNLTPTFRDYDARFDTSLFLGAENQHWNRDGHRVAAETVARHFEDCLLAASNEACPGITAGRADSRLSATRP